MSEDRTRPYSKEEFDNLIEEGHQEQVRVNKLFEENKKLQAEIMNKKLKIQSEEVNRMSSIQESLEEEDITERKFSKSKMLKELEDRKNSVLFLNEKISKHFIAAPSSLIVIPSMTNNGKSTLTAHISEALVNDNKRVLILSNEEKEEDVRARISCLRTNVSFGDYKTNKCSTDEIETVLVDAEKLANEKKLIVISPQNEADAYKVTTVKGVMTTLEKAKGNFDAVLIDYYTNVNMSEVGTTDPWHVNNTLASKLNIFKDSAPFPMFVFAQCDAIRTDKKVDNKGQLDFESNHPMYRWKGGKSILLYATDIIELVKDFENSCSVLFAHKVRFSHGDLLRLHTLPFDKKQQRFVEMTAEWDAAATISKVTRKSKDEVIDSGLGDIFKEKKDD